MHSSCIFLRSGFVFALIWRKLMLTAEYHLQWRFKNSFLKESVAASNPDWQKISGYLQSYHYFVFVCCWFRQEIQNCRLCFMFLILFLFCVSQFYRSSRVISLFFVYFCKSNFVKRNNKARHWATPLFVATKKDYREI